MLGDNRNEHRSPDVVQLSSLIIQPLGFITVPNRVGVTVIHHKQQFCDFVAQLIVLLHRVDIYRIFSRWRNIALCFMYKLHRTLLFDTSLQIADNSLLVLVVGMKIQISVQQLQHNIHFIFKQIPFF